MTNVGSNPYEPCVFLFIWNDVYYYGCTGVDNGGVPWCATQTVNDLYVSGYWGNCEEGCPGGSGNCIQLPVIQNSWFICVIFVLCLIYFHCMFQSLVNIWRYVGLLPATLLNMMMSFPLKLAQTYISYCKMAVDGNLIIDTNINVFTIFLFSILSQIIT